MCSAQGSDVGAVLNALADQHPNTKGQLFGEGDRPAAGPPSRAVGHRMKPSSVQRTATRPRQPRAPRHFKAPVAPNWWHVSTIAQRLGKQKLHEVLSVFMDQLKLDNAHFEVAELEQMLELAAELDAQAGALTLKERFIYAQAPVDTRTEGLVRDYLDWAHDHARTGQAGRPSFLDTVDGHSRLDRMEQALRACTLWLWLDLRFPGHYGHLDEVQDLRAMLNDGIERQLKANGWRASFLLHGQQERHLLGLMHASPQHLHWSQLCALFDPTAFDLAFAIVRDPLERAISEYRMRSKARVRPFDEWLHDALLKRASDPFHLDNHLRPQHEFVGPGVEVLRFEDGLDEGLMARLSRACGRDLVLQPLPRRADASLVRRAEVVPGRAALDLLARVYAEDYRRFGYPLP